MKKSIVLLITLALLVAISALIAIGVSLSQNASKDIERKQTLIQTATFVQNIADILARKSGEINSTDGLEMLILMPIELDSDELSLKVSFDSAAKGINPNNFVKREHNKTIFNPEYILLFDRILQSANVQSKELFLALIEDTLDEDLQERIPGSEMALYNKRFAQGSIENYKKFRMLIDRYVALTEDPNIYTIPWKKILDFHADAIDFNYIAPELLHYIVPYLDSETIRRITVDKKMSFGGWEDLRLPKEEKEELKKFHILFYVPIVKGELEFTQGDSKSFATFIYDIKKKKVLDIGYKFD